MYSFMGIPDTRGILHCIEIYRYALRQTIMHLSPPPPMWANQRITLKFCPQGRGRNYSNYTFQITFITKTWGLDQKFCRTKGKSRAPFKKNSPTFSARGTYRWGKSLLGALILFKLLLTKSSTLEALVVIIIIDMR